MSTGADRVWDLAVAGGGPVGLVTAIEARRRGMSVVVVEPRRTPIDKACGEGLMPSAVARLRELGIAPQGRPFVGIRYVGLDREVAARFRAGPGLGVRRTTLHAALSEAADRAGVCRQVGRVAGVRDDGMTVTAGDLRSRWLVAADGLHSPVRRELGLDAPTQATRPRFGLRRHFAVAPWTDHVEVHWSGAAEAYVTPVADDLVGVAVLGPPGTSYDDALADLPDAGGQAARRRAGHAGQGRRPAAAGRHGGAGRAGPAGGGRGRLRGRPDRGGAGHRVRGRPGRRAGAGREPAGGLPGGLGAGKPALPPADLGAAGRDRAAGAPEGPRPGRRRPAWGLLPGGRPAVLTTDRQRN